MKKEIVNRIQSEYPLNDEIIELSTPVLSFGDFQEAKVFTLGINPSNLEFLNRQGIFLLDNEKRFETYESLDAASYKSLNQDEIARIFNACKNYFNNNPYKRWFDKLEPILNKLNFSYYQGTAAHVDLVQWATKKKWSELENAAKERLIIDGRDFLEYQLNGENLELLLLNGRTVINCFEDWSKVKLKYQTIEGLQNKNAEIVEGYYNDKVRVLGWSTNIQSSRGVTNDYVADLSEKIYTLFNNCEN